MIGNVFITAIEKAVKHPIKAIYDITLYEGWKVRPKGGITYEIDGNKIYRIELKDKTEPLFIEGGYIKKCEDLSFLKK